MFTRKDLDEQVLLALDKTKRDLQQMTPLSPISAIIQRIKEAKKIEDKVKPTTWQ